MKKWWEWHALFGEMFGSALLTFGVLMVILVAKQKSFGLDTNLKKRVFMGTMVPLVIVMALLASKGFGAHAQLNPAVTLIVAAYEGKFQAVLSTIGFQLIGATLAAILFMASAKTLPSKTPMNEVFNFNQQGPAKTAKIELIGNMFWLIPVAGLVPAYLHGHIDFFVLAIGAAVGKVVLVTAFEEFGAANFNPQIWFGKMIVTAFAQKRKISSKELASELTGVVMCMAIGIAFGYLAHYVGVTDLGPYKK